MNRHSLFVRSNQPPGRQYVTKKHDGIRVLPRRKEPIPPQRELGKTQASRGKTRSPGR